MFTVSRGRKIMGAAYRKWRKIAEPEIHRQMHGQTPILGPYKLSLRLDRLSKAERDLSNYLKGPEDALVACGVVRDDSDCQAIYAEWSDKAPGKGAEVHILLVDSAETE
jgi:Holliday junction resolvase RusA-like endonuclease